MSLSADAIAFLAAKGLTLDEVVEFARLQEKRADPTAADRKRRQREREKEVSQRDVTRDTPLDKEIPPIPPKEINPPLPPSTSDEVDPPSPENPILLPEHIVEVWNETAGRLGLPKARLTDERKRKLAARIKRTSIEDWTEAICAVERNPWLCGENERGWRADLDFLLQPKSFTKLIEGSYDRAG